MGKEKKGQREKGKNGGKQMRESAPTKVHHLLQV